MDGKDIQIFFRAAQTKSFKQTGSDLGMTQSCVSKHIASLEEEVGEKLFKRCMGQYVELTPEGEIYANTFIKCKTLFDAMQKQFDLYKKPEKTVISIGCGNYWDVQKFYYLLKKNIQDKQYPVEVNLHFGSSVQMVQMLLDGKLDFVTLWEDSIPQDSTLDLKKQYLCTMKYVVLFSEKLLKKTGYPDTLLDLKGKKALVLQDVFQHNSTTFSSDIYDLGFVPDFICVEEYDTLLMKLRIGEGFCIQDELALSWDQKGLECLYLDKNTHWYLVYKNGADRRIQDIIIDSFREFSAQMLSAIHERMGY